MSLLSPRGVSLDRLDHITRPHFTKPSFHLQLAGWVLVRHPGGDSSSTALRAGAPLGAPLHTRGGGGRLFVWDVISGESWPKCARSHGCDCILNDRVLQVFTHPLPAALPRQPDELWVWTVGSGMTSSQRTCRLTAQTSTCAVAEGVTGGL